MNTHLNEVQTWLMVLSVAAVCLGMLVFCVAGAIMMLKEENRD